MRSLLVAVSAVVAVAVAGCGEDDSTQTGAPSDSPSSAASDEQPACTDVWVDKAPLPDDYRGCYEDGQFVKADKQMCSFGTEMVTYGDRFYGILGKWVNEVDGSLEQSRQYRKAYNTCTA
jgi:hypothetical protein